MCNVQAKGARETSQTKGQAMTSWPLLAPLWFADAVVLGHKCCAHGCLAVATWRSYWPGREPLVLREALDRLSRET